MTNGREDEAEEVRAAIEGTGVDESEREKIGWTRGVEEEAEADVDVEGDGGGGISMGWKFETRLGGTG